MFESIDQARRFDLFKHLAMFVVSAVVHLAAILLLVILPQLLFNVLPQTSLLTFLFAAPAPPAAQLPPTPPAENDREAKSGRVLNPTEFSPAAIPDGITPPSLDEDPIVTPQSVYSGIFGTGSGSAPMGTGGSGLAGLLGTAIQPPPPPPPPRPADRKVRQLLGGNVLEGKLLRKIEPTYPELARKARIAGMVILQVSIDEEGNVEEIRLLRGHPLLNEAAVDAVRQWRYSPTLLNGEPVPVLGTITIVFNLR